MNVKPSAEDTCFKHVSFVNIQIKRLLTNVNISHDMIFYLG